MRPQKFGLFSILLLSIFVISMMPQASAGICDWFPFWFCDDGQSNTLEYGNKWVLDYTTDDDYFLWMDDPKNKKTEVCLLHKTATKLGDLPNSMPLYKYDGELLEDLNRKKQTIDDKDWYGFCRKLDNDDVDWLKFNNHSTVIVYENNTLSAIDDNNNTIQDVILYENEECLVDCYASGRAVIYNDSALFEGFDFVDMNNNTINLSNSYILIQNDTWYNETVKVWTYNCSNVTAPNSTVVEQCDSNYTLANKSVHDNSYYVYTPNTVLPVGSYNWRLEADKGRQNLDWAFSFQGFGTEEVREYWAWWNSSWDYKKEITGITGEYPTFNVTYDADMNTNFSDIRFLDSSETVELNHTLRVKNDGVNATFTVDVNGNTTIYMYFGNPTAQSTSNVNATFNEPVFMVTWDDGIVDLITNTTGTAVNSPVVQNGIIGSAYNCSAPSNQYFNFGDVAKMSAGGDMTLFGIFKTGDIGVDANPVDYVMGKDGVAPRGWAFGFTSTGVTNTNIYNFEVGGAGSPDSWAIDIPDGEWIYSVWRYSDSGDSIDTWYNGTSNNNNSITGALNDVSYDTHICQRSYPGSAQKYDGIVDDMILYDRALSDDEIADLNSMSFQEVTFGAKDSIGGLTISLLTPENFYETANPVVDFECSCVPGFGESCTTLNMTIDGSEVNSTEGTGSLNLTYTASFDDGNYNWSCFAQNTTGALFYSAENRTFFVDGAEPFVNITSPANATIVYDFGENVTLNWTIFDVNGTLDSCWYELSNDSLQSNDIGDATSVSLGVGSKIYYFNNDSTTGSIGDITFNYNFAGYHELSDVVLTNIASWSGAGTDLNCYTQTYDNSTVSFPTNIGNESCVLLANGTYTKLTVTGNSSFDWYYQEIGLPEYPVTCNDNSTVVVYPASNPDNLTITLYANDTVGNEGNDEVTLFKNTVSPQITVTSPVPTYGSLPDGETVDLDFSIATNGTLDVCYYDYNGSTTFVSCSANTTFSYVEGVNNLTFFANDTLGNLGNTSVSWNVLSLLVSEFFLNETIEGVSNPFYIVVNTTDSIVSGTLFYDGSEYGGTIVEVSPNLYNVSYELISPSVASDTNFTFNWEISLLSGSNATFASNVQLVQAIDLDNCSSYPYSILNVSLYEERSREPLLGTIELLLDVLNTVDFESFEVLSGNFTNVSNTLVCSSVNLSGQALVYSAEIKYYADGFESELYYIQRSPFDDVDNVDLYDLNSTFSTEFLVEYENENFVVVPEAVIQLQRRYIPLNVYSVVEAPLTSDEGTAIVHVDLDANTYKATVVKDGEVLDIFENLVFHCDNELSGQCVQNLRGSIDPNNFVDIETTNDFAYSISDSGDTVTATFSIPSGTTSTVNLQLRQVDGFGNSTVCNETIISSAGSIICSYNNQTITESYLYLTLNKNGEPQAIKTYFVSPSGNLDFLETNFLLVFIFLLSIVGMAFSSPEWVVINGIMVMLLSGMLYLLNGLNFVMGLGSLMWLVIASGILIFKMAKQEDR